jgi:hypothetical protein
MKILAIEREVEGKSHRDFESHLKSEALHVWKLYQEDKIREIYFDKEKNSAVIILESIDEIEARSILNNLPLVKENLIDFEIISLVPYAGFGRLFKE